MDMDFVWHTRAEKLEVVAYWWEQQQGLCCICNILMLPYKRQETNERHRATIEHLIPRRANGPNSVGNVRLAHASCNAALGGLFSVNQERAKKGLPPFSREWALQTGAKLDRSSTRTRRRAKPPAELVAATIILDSQLRKPNGTRILAWATDPHFSLPRGATLLPAYEPIARELAKHAAPHKRRKTMPIVNAARPRASHS